MQLKLKKTEPSLVTANCPITVYIYTAWDGYSWHGCDGPLAKILDLCVDDSGTRPGNLDGEIPFGGISACVVDGEKRIAVFRHHVRKHGDALGRDSLFTALALLPFPLSTDVGIDLEKLLSHPALASIPQGEPQAVEFQIAEITCDLGSVKAQPYELAAKTALDRLNTATALAGAIRDRNAVIAENAALKSESNRLRNDAQAMAVRIEELQRSGGGPATTRNVIITIVVVAVVAAIVPILVVMLFFKL